MSEVDLDYNFSSSVTDTENTKDPDHGNVSILRTQLKECDDAIALHNTFDVIDLTSKISVENQMIAHRLFVTYLRSFRQDLDNKVKELGNGW